MEQSQQPRSIGKLINQIALGLIAFFLMQFYFEVKGIRKDVTTALETQGVILERIANRDQTITAMQDRIMEMEKDNNVLRLNVVRLFAYIKKEDEIEIRKD